MKRSHSARAMATEGLVIVVSILIAFGVDAWWERVVDRADEEEVLRAIQSDFRTRDEVLETVLQDLALHTEASESLVAALSSVEPGGVVTVSEASVRYTLMFSTLRVPVSGFDASGVEDPELRGLLRTWEARVRATIDRLDTARDMVFAEVRPLLASQVDLARLDRQAYEQIVLGREIGEGELGITQSPELVSVISGRGLLLYSAQRDLVALAELSKQVQERAAAQLSTG